MMFDQVTGGVFRIDQFVYEEAASVERGYPRHLTVLATIFRIFKNNTKNYFTRRKRSSHLFFWSNA